MPRYSHYLRRPGRWLRRTQYVLTQTLSDIGLRGATANGPAWLRDNPFLLKTGRTETRRLGLSLRLLVAVTLLSGLLLGGLWLNRVYTQELSGIVHFLFAASFPPALFILLTFVHILLIGSARTALSVPLAEEARRGTLPDLLLTPLRRAEMLLAMGGGPARTALTVALVGLPIYALLGEIGALTVRDIFFLYLLFALMSYAPPVYAFPALSGASPALPASPSLLMTRRAATRSGPLSGQWLWPVLSVFFISPFLGAFGGGWLGHLLQALHVSLGPLGRLTIFFAWPYYAVQILGGRLDFFHLSLSPLFLFLPLIFLNWIASALGSAAALSAADTAEMQRIPLNMRARTVARWTARAAGLCALGVVWKAWVESGDTATLAGGTAGVGGWDAAGLLLLLGGLSLPNVCHRALYTDPRRKLPDFPVSPLRPPSISLRRAAKRAIRPLCVAGVTFVLACGLGGLSPFAPPVYQVAGRIALAGVCSVVWAVGVRRAMTPNAKDKSVLLMLLYGLPMAALSLPGFSLLAAFSPASSWLWLFPSVVGLFTRFPLWHLSVPPSFDICLAGSALTGLLLLGVTRRQIASVSKLGTVNPEMETEAIRRPSTVRNAARTAVLMAWITERTDNPLFTYELRTRTRSGRWADWWIFVGAGVLTVLIMGLGYPDIVNSLSFLSPFRFFTFAPGAALNATPWAAFASLLLTAQVWTLGLRGQLIGDGLIARDRQRGIWGFILLTPLTAREIFWGKVAGQTILPSVVWALCGLASLLLYLLTSPLIGIVPALVAWFVGQIFVAALFLLGVGLGAALSTYPVFSKGLRGFAGLVFTAIVGIGVWGQFHLLPLDAPGGWSLMATRLMLGSGLALVLAVPLLSFAQWRVGDLRRQDIAVGDGVE